MEFVLRSWGPGRSGEKVSRSDLVTVLGGHLIHQLKGDWSLQVWRHSVRQLDIYWPHSEYNNSWTGPGCHLPPSPRNPYFTQVLIDDSLVCLIFKNIPKDKNFTKIPLKLEHFIKTIRKPAYLLIIRIQLCVSSPGISWDFLVSPGISYYLLVSPGIGWYWPVIVLQVIIVAPLPTAQIYQSMHWLPNAPQLHSPTRTIMSSLSTEAISSFLILWPIVPGCTRSTQISTSEK